MKKYVVVEVAILAISLGVMTKSSSDQNKAIAYLQSTQENLNCNV